MAGIGHRLRQERESRGLSLDQVHRATRIKTVFLEAIEADRFSELPGPVQARGFIRSYASYLGVDADNLLARLDGVSNGSVSTPDPAAPRKPDTVHARGLPPHATRPFANSVSSLPLPLPLLILGAIVLFVIGGLLILQALGGESPAPRPAPPLNVPSSIGDTTPAPTPMAAADAGVSVTLTASEHVWVRVSNDGFTAFEGILPPASPQSWQGQQQIIVETGNGAALTAAVNGQPAGVLGPRNRVVIRAWGPEGEVTPPPTATPSLPATPEATATP
jgi:cytoskeletal protein RodZ